MNRYRFATSLRGFAVLVTALVILSTTGPRAVDLVSDHLAGPAELVNGTGADGTFNVVILGDGFTSAQMPDYRDAVNRLVTMWMGTEPFASEPNAISIYRLDVISDEQGIDVPAKCGGEPYDTPLDSSGKPFDFSRSAKHPDNILQTHWCAEDVLSGAKKKRFIGSKGDRVSQFALASKVAPNLTIVIVNDWMFGATAYPDDAVLYVSLSKNLIDDINPDTHKKLEPNDPTSFPAVVIHEVGHLAPFRLLDEYATGRDPSEFPTEKPVIDASPNLTTVLSPLPWASLAAPGSSGVTNCSQTSPPAVGAVVGGYGFADKVYHSSCSCKMDDYPVEKFCLVCRQQISKVLVTFAPKPHGH